MKYIIYRAHIVFKNGSKSVINYDENNVTETNACNDIQVFKQNLKHTLELYGLNVDYISLVYAERDGRK